MDLSISEHLRLFPNYAIRTKTGIVASCLYGRRTARSGPRSFRADRLGAPHIYRYVGLTLAKAVVARPGAGARGADHQATESGKPHAYRVPIASPRNPGFLAAGAKGRGKTHSTPKNARAVPAPRNGILGGITPRSAGRTDDTT
jgi:hypothetical protein